MGKRGMGGWGGESEVMSEIAKNQHVVPEAGRIDLIDELSWRGLIHQATDLEGLRRHLASGRRRVYVGFDPTADSLTIGNLVPIMMLVHVVRAGHEPVVLMGGGTGMIGDPSGKSAERQLQTMEMVEQNIDRQRPIFERVFNGAGLPTPSIVNNADWLTKLGYIEVLRDVGKHFSVNQMIQRDSVKSRLDGREHGISYTEFSYMILQAYDFLHLFRDAGVTVQMGGSDQWGNIVSGCDLIRRAHGEAGQTNSATAAGAVAGDRTAGSLSFGLTASLVTKADGGKFGKSEAGAVWLSAPRAGSSVGTSAYAYSQFWLNADDADVGKFLRLFTLLSKDEIESLERSSAENPAAREAQRALSRFATSMLHGDAERERAEAAARALFSGDVRELDEALFEDVLSSAPSSTHERARLVGEGVPLVDVLAETTLASSKSEARKHLSAGAVSVNGEKADAERRLVESDLLHGRAIALRRGKKAWHVTRWS